MLHSPIIGNQSFVRVEFTCLENWQAAKVHSSVFGDM